MVYRCIYIVSGTMINIYGWLVVTAWILFIVPLGMNSNPKWIIWWWLTLCFHMFGMNSDSNWRSHIFQRGSSCQRFQSWPLPSFVWMLTDLTGKKREFLRDFAGQLAKMLKSTKDKRKQSVDQMCAVFSPLTNLQLVLIPSCFCLFICTCLYHMLVQPCWSHPVLYGEYIDILLFFYAEKWSFTCVCVLLVFFGIEWLTVFIAQIL